MASSIISARLDDETLALVDQVAAAQGRSRSWFAARAIRAAAREEAELLAFVQEGIDALDRGEFVEHEVVMRDLDAMLHKHEARCRG